MATAQVLYPQSYQLTVVGAFHIFCPERAVSPSEVGNREGHHNCEAATPPPVRAAAAPAASAKPTPKKMPAAKAASKPGIAPNTSVPVGLLNPSKNRPAAYMPAVERLNVTAVEPMVWDWARPLGAGSSPR